MGQPRQIIAAVSRNDGTIQSVVRSAATLPICEASWPLSGAKVPMRPWRCRRTMRSSRRRPSSIARQSARSSSGASLGSSAVSSVPSLSRIDRCSTWNRGSRRVLGIGPLCRPYSTLGGIAAGPRLLGPGLGLLRGRRRGLGALGLRERLLLAAAGRRRLGDASGEALLQRLHEVDDLGAPDRGPDGGHLLALDLLVHEVEDPLPVGVLVPLGPERLAREAVDELEGELELALLEPGRLPLVDLAEVPHLVGEVHRVEQQAALGGAEQHEALLAAHHERRERHARARVQGLGEEPVGLLAALVGPEVVGLLEVDRVDRLERNELGDVDRPRGLALERFQLLVGDAHVLVLGELVAADERRALHDRVAGRAERLLADARAARGVEQVEGHAPGGRGRVEPDRDRDQPERDRPGADRVCRHGLHDSTGLSMMRPGSGCPMDSVPAAAGRPHLGVLTALAGLVLLALVILLLWLSWGRPRVEDVAEPARALALVVSRTLDLDEAVAGAPAWERRLWALAFNDRGQDLAEGLAWYAELAAVSRDPQVDLHLAVLEAEAGHLERVRRTLEEWQRRGGTFARWADLVGVAYLGATPDPARTPGLGAALGRPGGGDWFSDRLPPPPARRARGPPPPPPPPAAPPPPRGH